MVRLPQTFFLSDSSFFHSFEENEDRPAKPHSFSVTEIRSPHYTLFSHNLLQAIRILTVYCGYIFQLLFLLGVPILEKLVALSSFFFSVIQVSASGQQNLKSYLCPFVQTTTSISKSPFHRPTHYPRLPWSPSPKIVGLSSSFLEQSSEKISEDKCEQWKKLDYQLCALLWQSVEPTILTNFIAFKTCYSFWKKAKSVFANEIQQSYDDAQKLATLKQTDHDMVAYVSKARSAVEELKLSLEADKLEDIKTKLDNLYMVLVLRGMHPDFDHIHDQVLTGQEVPSLENLITRLLRVPSPKIGGNSVDSIETSTMVSNREGRGGHGNRGGRAGRRGLPQCSCYKRVGHTQDTCYSIHGFPRKSVNISKSETSEIKFSKTDYQEYLQLKAAKESQTSSSISGHNSTACISQFGNNQSPWIIDSGASDHIAGNSSLFSSLSPPKIPHFITLADGSRVAATGIGHVSPTSSLSLNSVLLIPGCPFNIISLSQLTRSRNCSVTFDANSFVIQERGTGRTIGVGHESHGLYYLKPNISWRDMLAERAFVWSLSIAFAR
ncbi:hypothetical protein D0Y65_030482 [Glycine soja]|uniref:Retrovirus-related Pol polyprotein from transposon TNT 1-94-like beta-barrel domain-containing protein n=1 Tax=Glycine soja TaxID=3848 RepID=A0A445I4U7_GLYSO|nr:hypothetical protein D0Y65_030482 [Glycine soja]